MGCQYSVTSRTVYGDTISFSKIMGSQYSVTGHMATHYPSPISWAVKTPSMGPTINGYTLSSPEIMGCQYSVTGAYCL
ncbi:hypothetical protein Bpfe_002354 [Biomphalaria pfeifferi]|uniref:Uncharacterized protein n=1 Tax=Biomphalaria pfeifferi TaxID=112525 RepID=A0AAD8FMC9_BIOPF|nr:hypothetical protein Bpfe_002354 [Biomphalaria pfeifferi]